MSKQVTLDKLSVVYNDRGSEFTALQDVSFSVQPGEFVSVIGSSGCGKSTMLSVLEGLLEPSSGRVLIDGEPVSGCGTERSVVFQQYSLFPWMSAEKNVEFALEQAYSAKAKGGAKAKLSKSQRRELAQEYLRRVGLSGFEHRFPKELSGGQQQRVAIARALAQDAEVLLMDEPFGAIDAKNRAILQDLLLELWEGGEQDERKTVIFITHDLEEAILLSDRIIMMEPNPGRIRAEFKVELPRPRHRLELLRSEDYVAFRSKLAEIFFEEETLKNSKKGEQVA